MHFFPHPPISVTVPVTAGGGVLIKTTPVVTVVQLTHISGGDVFLCSYDQTPEAGKGFCLQAGMSIWLDGENVPRPGLKAIADTTPAVVAIGQG